MLAWHLVSRDTSDLPYVQFGYADYNQALVPAGLSQSIADLYTEMCQALNEASIRSNEGRRPENTTPTRFEACADMLAGAYAAA